MNRLNHGILPLKSPVASYWSASYGYFYNNPKIVRVLSLLVILLFQSCFDESIDNSSLYGKWSIVVAKRNSKETETLKDAFFIFHNDTLMSTNILRSVAEYPFERNDDEIIQKGPVNILYKIVKNTRDSLILHSTINTYDFEFIALKDTSYQL